MASEAVRLARSLFHAMPPGTMLIRLTAKVDSSAVVDEPFGVEQPPYAVDLGCDAHNRVTEIRVEKRLSAGVKLPQQTATPEGTIQFDIPLDDPEYQDILALTQYLESIGSFWFGFNRVHWAEAKYEWVPESDDDRAALGIFSAKASRRYRETIRKIDPPVLARTLAARSRLEHLTIPMAFFREGVNEHRDFRYVNAIHNLYFFLEGLYAKGKTNNKEVLRSFLSEEMLMDAVAAAIVWLDKPEEQRHKRRLREWQSLRNLDWTTTGVLSLMIWMRGNLHHFSARSSTPKGHPLNQRDFESLSMLYQLIAHTIVGQLAR